jgi:hypothetical protein
MKTKPRKAPTAEQKARKAEAQRARRAAKRLGVDLLAGDDSKAAETKARRAAKKAAATKALTRVVEALDGAAIPAPKPAPAAKPAAPLGKRAQIEADAQAGKVPAPPDFSAATHASYRKRLAALVALVEAGDLKGLKAHEMLRPYNSSIVALHRYRDLAITALRAQTK